MFLKNRNISSKIKRSKVTDNAAKLSKKKDYIFRALKHLDVIFIILINVKMPTIAL